MLVKYCRRTFLQLSLHSLSLNFRELVHRREKEIKLYGTVAQKFPPPVFFIKSTYLGS
jgi:hypothetical protein